MNEPKDPPSGDGLAALASHRIAFEDPEFLHRPEMRSFRLALEYAKAQLAQQETQVESTVVVFGSARVASPERAEAECRRAERELAAAPGDGAARARLERAHRRLKQARYYEEARRFAALVSEYAQHHRPYEFVITTGGGPGIMEAANRGAYEAGRKTMGFNIEIPHEQEPNPYISPELCFNFHYFAIRKMHLLLRARALVIFPGGFGTLDELFEALTLVQTGKMQRIPIVVLGREYWQQVLNLDAMVEAGTISAGDLELIDWADTAEEAWQIVREFWRADGSDGQDKR